MRNTKKKMMVTPKIHNHNQKYNTRSKRNCYLCSSTQGCIGEKEHEIQNREPLTGGSTQNTCPKRLVGRRQGVRNKRLVACSAQSSGLPVDLIHTILLPFPVKLLHENMRLVSRVWRQTITSPCFIANHLQISLANHTHGLLVDHPNQQNIALYIKPTTSDANPEFQVTELAKSPFDSRIRGSYHGLVLIQHARNKDQFHVVNPVTKSIVSLPSFPLLASLSPKNGALTLDGVAISYASSINRYKVVIGIQGKQFFQYFPPQVWVYTIGIDQNWRKLELQGIDEIHGTISRMPFHTPRSVGGIVYWSCLSHPYGCALDVDTETFYKFTMFATPNTIDPEYWIICLQTGLGLVVVSHKVEFRSRYVLWELYELTDLKSSKWTKIIDIDVRVIHSQIEKYYQPNNILPWLRPVVYTNDEKLWFVSRGYSTCMFYYHTRKENVMQVPVTRNCEENIGAYHHVNTLVALKNC